MIPHISSNDNSWVVVIDSKPYKFNSTHEYYDALVECVRTGDVEEFLSIFDTGINIVNWSEGDFTFQDGYLYYQTEQIADEPTRRIIKMMQNGWDHKPMLRYLNNLYQNTSNRAVQESYTWCVNKGIPITPDGYLIGYKGVVRYDGDPIMDNMGREIVAGDLVDKYTKKSYRNNPGDINYMPRRQVNDNCSIGCADGLHVGTYEYACGWAGNDGVVVLVKFNPADIVSVPIDCSYAKLRCSHYEVLSVAREEIHAPVYQCEDDLDDEDDFDDDYYDDDDDYYDGDDWS